MNPEISNNDTTQIPVFNPKYKDATLVYDGADTWAKGMLLGLRKIIAGAVTANVGNTGDGTVTGLALAPGGPPMAGAWNLEATAAGADGRIAGAVTPGGGNTGDGTVTGLAVDAGKTPKVGNFSLKCVDADEGGTATSTSVTITGTGDGVPGAVTPAVDIVEGLYTLTCVEAVTNKGRFEVADPDGNRLEDLNVTVAYSNNHFALTVADGANDYIVGDTLTFTITIAHGGKFELSDPEGTVIENDIQLPGTPAGTVDVTAGGIDFTITDGATDFAVDDSFLMAIAAADGGVFKLEDPEGNIVANDITMSGTALGATTFIRSGMTFILTDGATDFVSGDKFALAMTATNKYTIYDASNLDGSEIPVAIMPKANIETGAGDVRFRILISGEVAESELSIDDGSTITETIRQQLRDFTILSRVARSIDGLDNQ